MKKQTAALLLLFTTVIWGGGFVATKIILDTGFPPGLINVIRGFIFSLLVFCFFPKQIIHMSKEQLRVGTLIGVFNFGGFLLQTIGAQYTTPSNSSFLTTTNVVMVPILAFLLYKVKLRIQNIIAVAVCLFGMAILSGVFSTNFTINIGDLYTLLCALSFALSIVMLSKPPEGGHFAAGAFLLGITLFIGSLIYFFIFEGASIPSVDYSVVILPLLYLAIGSSFIAQTLQVLAQRHISATSASLILLLEAVFGSLFSILYGFEKFTLNLLIGGSLILVSLVLSEINLPVFQKNKTSSK